MGLINWFKDKIILSLEHDVKLLQADIARLDSELDSMRSSIASVRRQGYKRAKKDDDDEDDDEDSGDGYSEKQMLKDLAAVRAAFGGELPIELREKYKNVGNN